MKNVLTKIWPYIFLACFTALLFSPFLFFGMMPAAGDEQLGVFYPNAYVYQQSIQKGESLLWNNFYYGGFPTYLNIITGSLYPLHWILFRFLPFFTAYHLAMVIPVFLGMAFAFAFARASKFSIFPSLLFAMAYAIGQTFAALYVSFAFANGFFVLPLLLFIALRIRQSDSVRALIPYFLAGVAGGAVGFLAGVPHIVLYSITFAWAYALFLDITGQGESLIWRFRTAFFLVLAVAGGAVLALPQLLPTWQYLDLSVRVPGYTAQVSESLPWGEWIYLFLPPNFDIPQVSISTAGFYIGVFPFIFALMAVIFFRTREVWFFLISYFILFAMAADLAPFSWFNRYFPVFSRITSPTRWLYAAAIPLAYLAAHGFNEFLNKPREWFQEKKFINFLRGGLAASFLIVGGIAALNIFLARLSQNPDFKSRLLSFILGDRARIFPFEHYAAAFDLTISDLRMHISLLNPAFGIPVLLIPAAVFLIYFFARNYPFRWLGWCVIMATALNAWLAFSFSFDSFIPQSLLAKEPAVLRIIKARESDLASFRILPFLFGEGMFRELTSRRSVSAEEQAILHREFLTNQIGAFYGLQNMWGYESLRTMRQNQLIETVLAPGRVAVFDAGAVKNNARIDQKVNDKALRVVSIEEKAADFAARLPLLSMMNVKYIISIYPLGHPGLREIPVEENSSLSVPFHLYENMQFLPRTYFARHPFFWRGSERDLLLAVAENKDFKEKTFIECKDCKETESQGKVTVNEYLNGKVKLSVETEKGGWLVFSESNIPGWIAEIDGKRAQIYNANYLFQAVYVPEGSHEVLFEYQGSSRLFLEKMSIY
ncbi:MAG: YfhO family protein [Candidatus Sungbacteria bacterium]|nr:YfhO family protein [Candidatus Sungbacteria bacterium]